MNLLGLRRTNSLKQQLSIFTFTDCTSCCISPRPKQSGTANFDHFLIRPRPNRFLMKLKI